jgi:hypothetical protein
MFHAHIIRLKQSNATKAAHERMSGECVSANDAHMVLGSEHLPCADAACLLLSGPVTNTSARPAFLIDVFCDVLNDVIKGGHTLPITSRHLKKLHTMIHSG